MNSKGSGQKTATQALDRLPAPFRSILHPTDLNPKRFNALYHALRIGLAAKCRLEILNIVPPGVTSARPFPQLRKTLIEWGVLAAQQDGADLCDTGLSPAKVTIEGNLIPVVTGRVKRGDFDLLILSTHNYKTRSKSFVGSKAEILSRRSELATLFLPEGCPGFVEPKDGQLKLTKVLLPVSDDPHPQAALTRTFSLLHHLGIKECEVTLFFVGRESKFPRIRLFKSDSVQWHKVCSKGTLTNSILSFCNSWQPDLVVMPTRSNLEQGHSPFASQTERVLRECHCPLLSIPAKL